MPTRSLLTTDGVAKHIDRDRIRDVATGPEPDATFFTDFMLPGAMLHLSWRIFR